MAKLTGLKRIVREDYDQKYHDLIDKLSFIINPAFEQIAAILNNGLTFGDNFRAQLDSVTVIVDATGRPTTPTGYQFKQGACQGTWVIFAQALTGSLIPTSHPFVTFSQSGTQIIIKNITGLQAGQKYQLRIVSVG